MLNGIGSLKYFYSNWKDYYYFPQEDKAIHKSVAVFADKAHREKASAETCFQRKPGCYIPVFGTSSMPLFFEEYHSSPAYIAVSETWLQDPMAIQEYCTGLFCSPEFRLIKKDPAQ